MPHRTLQTRLSPVVCASLTAVIVGLVVTPSRADTITFDRDTLGLKGNGFMSLDSNLVSFSDPSSGGPQITLENLNGNGTTDLAFFGTGPLLMHFTIPVTALSLTFGNDDPIDTRPGDRAVLTALSRGAFVGATSLVFNRNDVLDQTISFSGAVFDDALFVFANGVTGSPIPFLAEIVDDVTFAPTPEPAALSLMALGAVWIRVALVRKRKLARFANTA